MQIKTTTKYHLTLVRLAISKMSTNNTCWSRCGDKGILLHSWGDVNRASHYGKQHGGSSEN